MACFPGNQWLGGVPIWFEDPSTPPVCTFPLGCCKRMSRVLIACRTNSCSQWGRMVVVEEEGLLSKLIPEPKPFKNQSWLLTVWPGKSCRLSVSPLPDLLIWDTHLYGAVPNQIVCLKVLWKLDHAIMCIEYDLYKISCEQHDVFHQSRGFTVEIISWWYVLIS